MIVAIDGPAASGKSSVAKKLALKLNFLHFSTGEMYRAITAYCINNNLISNLPKSVIDIINDIDIYFKDNDFNKLILDDLTYSDNYYDSLTNKHVSEVSSIAEVRYRMVEIQRSFSKSQNIVCEGRDIGTVVFPNAQYKFFLEASIECRAKRRFEEDSKTDNDITLDIIEKLLKKRDYLDINREISPLKKASDAIMIDTTELNLTEVVDLMYKKIKRSF